MDDLIIGNKYRYIIRLLSDELWYLFDVDATTYPHGMIWTSQIEQAFWFPDEESVEEFKKDFATPRIVEILRVDQKKFRNNYNKMRGH